MTAFSIMFTGNSTTGAFSGCTRKSHTYCVRDWAHGTSGCCCSIMSKVQKQIEREGTLIARFMGPTSRADRTQVGPMLAPWTLLSGYLFTLSSNYTVDTPEWHICVIKLGLHWFKLWLVALLIGYWRIILSKIYSKCNNSHKRKWIWKWHL